MPTLYVPVGIPGSGKTTYVKKHFPDAFRVCMDDLRLMFYGKNFDNTRESIINATALPLLKLTLQHAYDTDTDVVFDATSLSVKRRKPLIDAATDYGFDPVALYFEIPLGRAKLWNYKRAGTGADVPDSVIEGMYKVLTVPSLEEGFFRVVTINQV